MQPRSVNRLDGARMPQGDAGEFLHYDSSFGMHA